MWMVGSFVLRSLFGGLQQNTPTRIHIDQLPTNAVVDITIHMEQIKGWWYGWFCNEDGTETFVSQGTTYDDALNNCKQRVQERNPQLKVRYNFEMKNANTTIQD